MERKIGEIFEYNGEWYQCVSPGLSCAYCDMNKHTCYGVGACSKGLRTDGKEVVYKKLEKVGEPFTSVGKLYQHYKVFDINNVYGDVFWCVHNYKAKTLTIEIKQNKEDMEENKLNLKPFDIQKAKEGKPVCTRDGRKARIICFDAKGTHPIIALVSDPDIEGAEIPFCYTNDGFYNNPNCESNHDLMMLPEKKEGWVNVYKERVYKSKEEAVENKYDGCTYIDTIKVEWEE